MNRKPLQNIKDALLKDSPNIEYALGILDTLMDSLPDDTPVPVPKGLLVGADMSDPTGATGTLPNPIPGSRIEEIMRLSAESTEK